MADLGTPGSAASASGAPGELEKALSEDMRQIAAKWNIILNKLPQMLKIVLLTAHPSIGAGNQLLLVFDHEIDKRLVDSGNHLEEIKKTVEAVIGKQVEVATAQKGEEGEGKANYPDLTQIIKKIPFEYVDE